jgi:hypothetical protein
MDHKHNDGVREEVRITDINAIIKNNYQNNWLEHLEKYLKLSS